MRDISLRNLTESRGFEDKKTEDAVHQCSACGMHDDICPSGQCTCSGGGTPENGVTALEDTVAETIPTKGMTIAKGGIYEVKGDTYTGSIIVTSSEPVTINITGNVTSTGDPFVSAQGSGKLEINNNGFTVNCKNRHFLYTYTPADVTVDGGIYKTGGGIFLIMAFSGQLTLKNVDAWAEQASALTSAANVHVMDSQFHHTGVSGNKYAAVNNSATMTLNNVKIVSTEGAITILYNTASPLRYIFVSGINSVHIQTFFNRIVNFIIFNYMVITMIVKYTVRSVIQIIVCNVNTDTVHCNRRNI